MSDCIFCKIISGEIPSTTIYEDDEFKIILDRFPANKGHALILPKKHYANIFEMDEDTAAKLFALAVRTAKTIKIALKIKNMNILQNNGPLAGQTVNHFHLHLIPRYDNDNIDIKWSVIDLTDQDMEDMGNKLAL